MAEYQTAQRSRHKAERVGCEREQRTHRRIKGRKEQLVKNQRGGRSVEKKVVPLDRRTDQAGGCNFDMRRLFCFELTAH